MVFSNKKKINKYFKISNNNSEIKNKNLNIKIKKKN